MVKLFTALAELLDKLLTHWERRQRQAKRKEHQADVEQLRESPVDYANDKFGSVRESSTKDVQRDKANRP